MTDSLFCKKCENLLTNITTADKFYFKCMLCYSEYEPEPKDTLRYVEKGGTNIFTYDTILLLGAKDPVNPKAYKTCPKCKHEICKQVRLISDMKLINICIKCNNKWFEGMHE